VDYVQFELLHFATYVLENDERAVRLTSMGAGERPDDEWLSVAEALDFLPAE